MKGSDLPHDVKREVLKQIEQQVGATQYAKMIGAVGEDKLLDMAIDQARPSAGTPTRGETRGFAEKYGWWVVWIGILFSLSPQGIGFQVLAIALCVVVAVRWFRDRGIGIGKLIGGLLGFGFAYVLGLAILGGGSQWWQHLLALPVGVLWLWIVSR